MTFIDQAKQEFEDSYFCIEAGNEENTYFEATPEEITAWWVAKLESFRQLIEKEVEERKEYWAKLHEENMPRNTLIGFHADSCIRALTDLQSKISKL